MRSLSIIPLLAFSVNARAAEFPPEIPRACEQLVVVTSPSWDSSHGTLRTFARPEGKWVEHGQPRPVLLGERGLAWGLGLHDPPALPARRKREGDRRAPAGMFALVSAFGSAPAAQFGNLRIPYHRIAADSEAVDDPLSRFYNRVVRRSEVARPDWRSSEQMSRISEYALGVIVAHNPGNIPGAGSCIFLHEWSGDHGGTAGCTVLRRDDLRELVQWLDGRRQPLLVQAPRSVLPAGFP